MAGEFAGQVKAMQENPGADSGTAAVTPPTGTVTSQGPSTLTSSQAPASTPTPTPGAPGPPDQSKPADVGAPAPAPEGTAPAATPAAEGATPTDDQRVTDAQRKMHEATTAAAEALKQLDTALRENVALKETLTQIDRAPDLAPVAAPTGLPSEEQFDTELRAALKEYQTPTPGADGQVDDDATAFVKFETKKADLLQRRLEARRQHQRVQELNAQRAQTVNERVATSITTFVATHAPDVPIGLFWWHTRQAQAETPASFKGVEAYDWQVKRAIALARAELGPRMERTAQAATEAAHVTNQSGVVMPAGGSPPAPAAPAEPGRPKTMVEQLREQQAKVLAMPAT